MTTPWRAPLASRLVAGRFWTPDLSLDMMGRDWGRFEHHSTFIAARIASGYQSVSVTATTVQLAIGGASGSFCVRFPDKWEDDDTFANFEYKIEIALFWYIAPASQDQAFISFDHNSDLGVGNADFNGVAGIDYKKLDIGGAPDVGVSGSGNRKETLIWRKFKGLPKGLQIYTFLKLKEDAGGSSTVNFGIDPIVDTPGTYENFPGQSARIVIDT